MSNKLKDELGAANATLAEVRKYANDRMARRNRTVDSVRIGSDLLAILDRATSGERKFNDIREALDAIPVGGVIEERHRMVKAENGGWRYEVDHIESRGYYTRDAVTPTDSEASYG